MDKNIYYDNTLYIFNQILDSLSKEDKYLYLSIQKELFFFIYFVISNNKIQIQDIYSKNVSEWKLKYKINNIELKNNIDYIEIYKSMLEKVNNKKNYIEVDFQKDKILFSTFDIDAHKYFSKDFFENYNIYIVSNKRKFNNLNIDNKKFLISNMFLILKKLNDLKYNLNEFLNSNFTFKLIFQCFFNSIFHSLKIKQIIKNAIKKDIHYFIQSDIHSYNGLSVHLWSQFYDKYTITYPHGSPLLDSKSIFYTDKYYSWGYLYKKMLLNKGVNNIEEKFPINSRKNFNVDSNFRYKENIKIVAITGGMIFNKDSGIFYNCKDLIKDLTPIIEFLNINNIEVVLKSHAINDCFEVYEKLETLFSNTKHIRNRWSSKDIANIDAVISIDASSSINAQFHSYGIPILYMGYHMDNNIYKYHFLLNQLVDIILIPKELEDKLYKMINNKEFYYFEQNRSFDIFKTLRLIK